MDLAAEIAKLKAAIAEQAASLRTLQEKDAQVRSKVENTRAALVNLKRTEQATSRAMQRQLQPCFS